MKIIEKKKERKILELKKTKFDTFKYHLKTYQEIFGKFKTNNDNFV